MRRAAAFLVTLAIGATALAGCGSGGSDSGSSGGSGGGTLRVLLAGLPADNTGQALIKGFEQQLDKKFPNVKVQPDFVPYDKLSAKLNTTVAMGQGYDVISAGIGWVQPMAGLKAIGPLDADGFSKDALEKTAYSNFVPPMLYNDQLYAVPITANPVPYALSKSAFRKAGLDPSKPPQSFAELRADAKKLVIRDSSGKLKQSGFDFWAGAGSYRQSFVGFLGSAGGSLFTDGKPAFNSAAGVQALTAMRGLIADGSSQFGEENTAGTPLVTTGAAAMGRTSPYVDCSTTSGIGKKCDDLVYFTLKDEKSSMFSGGRIAAIGSNTKLKDAAAEFIRVMQEPASQQSIAKMDVGIPIDKSSASSSFVKGNPASTFAAAHLDESITEFGGTNFLDFRSDAADIMDSVMLGKSTPQAALTKLTQAAQSK